MGSSYASHIESIDRLKASRDQGDVRSLAGGGHVMQPNECFPPEPNPTLRGFEREGSASMLIIKVIPSALTTGW